MLGKLEYLERHQNFWYRRRIKVNEVMRAISKMIKGKAIEPDEISMEFGRARLEHVWSG